MTQALAQHYDAIPFPGLPMVRSQPEFLETVGRLRGMRPAPAARCRVLELGCAVGQNLLPLAERYPASQFLGIDGSGMQIAAAQASAAEVSLTNIEFRQLDILDVDASLGTFDYIIAHGVYSWVEPEVRDKLLAVCRDRLAPQGIAYVSYKTYPGWHTHDMLRHMMLYDSRKATSPGEKMLIGRRLLDFLQSGLTEDNPWDSLVQGEVAIVARQGDDYLWHDHLEPVSHPVYFKQFVEHAWQHKLQMCGEAALGWRTVDDLGPELEKQLAALTQDGVEQEQFRDVVRNRAMRQTLLCHTAVELPGHLSAEVLTGLYLGGPLRPEKPPIDLKSWEVEKFLGAAGLRVATPLPLAKAALLLVGEAWPGYVPFEELVNAACERVEAAGAAPPPAEEVQRLRDNLLQCCLGHVVQLYAAPPSYATQPGERPAVSPLVRARAAAGQIVANRRHEAIKLDPFDQHLVGLLDGAHTQQQIIEHLAASVAEGKLTVMEHQQPVRTYDDAVRAFQVALPEALDRLAKSALLVQ
jgi:methyltransferase-like protein/2-polyprenyl-3-methyl-5-hydroxy-6-metoxy-1,4-benzoquinol methylase